MNSDAASIGWKRIVLFCALSALGSAGCSGGGGGDGGGSGKGRTKGTGVRVVHAGVDEPPLSLEVDGQVVTAARFQEPTFFQSLKPGSHTLRVFRTNAPGEVVREFTADFLEDTEYSVFVAGQDEGRRFDIQLVTETVSQPEKGRAFLKLFHGYPDEEELKLVSSAGSSEGVPFGSASSPIEVPAGPLTVTVADSDGNVLDTIAVELPERGEIAIVAAGARNLGYFVSRAFPDLD